jgi:hypothetical protein
MKLHSKERPNSFEPQLPLQAGSTPENSEKRTKKRRNKSKKNPLIEKKISAAHQAVETIIRQNEVRLIWDREAPSDEKASSLPAKKPRPEVVKKVAKGVAVEAVIDHAQSPKPEAKKAAEQPKPDTQKPALTEKAAKSEPVGKPFASTPEAFSELLDNLAAEQLPLGQIPEQAHATQAETKAETFASKPELPLSTPPTLPPEAKSYRHFFWNEPSIMSPAEAQAEHSMLPTVGQLRPSARAESANRTYVESQSSVVERPEKPPKENHPNQNATTFDRKQRAEQATEVPEQPNMQPETPPPSAEIINQQPFLEAVPLHDMSELQFPERMPGSDKPSAETVPAYEPVPQPESQPAQANIQPQQELGLAELIKLSKKIKIDGVKLHEIFTAGRIDEAGLRAVVQEFLRGGNVRKQLTDEIVNREKSYERDPSIRHLTSDQVRDKLANTSVKVVQKGYQLGKTSKHVTREATRVLKDAATQANQNLHDSGIDVPWPSIAAIVIIYTLIIILLIA